MIINIEKYESNYIEKDGDKITANDLYEDFIKLLPFMSNPSHCKYDSNCGFSGVTGEFFRRGIRSKVNPIESVDQTINSVRQYLLENKILDDKNNIESVVSVIRDILVADKNKFNVIDASFLKYQPIYQQSNDKYKKYKAGQERMAKYLLSMVDDDLELELEKAKDNVINTIVRQALDSLIDGMMNNRECPYVILPFVKKQFNEDFRWLLSQEDDVVRKNIDKFLHFYLCFSVTQTILSLSIETIKKDFDKPEELFFVLSTEHVSGHSDAVINGWDNKLNEKILKKIFGQLQTLDILNAIISNTTNDEGKTSAPIGSFSKILSRLEETPFELNKEKCETILYEYQKAKTETITSRNSDKKSGNISNLEEFTRADSYEMFIRNLYTLCVRLCSTDYETKMKANVYDLMKIKFLKVKKNYTVLTLDEDMLIFFFSMVVKNGRLRLDVVYERMACVYGIRFNMASRNQIEQILLNYNILDRKSDSGEVQYVSIIL